MKLCRYAIAVLLGVTTFGTASAQSGTYTVTDLGSLGGQATYSGGYAFSLSERGQVAGAAFPFGATVTHGFVSGLNGAGLTDLGTLGGQYSIAYSVNVVGQVAGGSGLSASGSGAYPMHAFVYSPAAGMRDLGTLGGASSEAYAINDSGLVTGYSETLGGLSTQAFITALDGTGLIALGTLGGPSSAGLGINEFGRVVGVSALSAFGPQHAFITGNNGLGMSDLGALAPGGNSAATAINFAGQVVGYAAVESGGFHAFITAINGGFMSDIGTLGGANSFAYGVNSKGQVVGAANFSSAVDRHAFLTGVDGVGMVDINDLTLVGLSAGVFLTEARDINDLGQIVANGTDGHAYLLSPSAIPEPSPPVMLFGGLLILGYVTKRRA